MKCVVAQCPTISGSRNALRRFPGDGLTDLRRRLDADRLARFRNEAPAMIPIAPDLDNPATESTDDIGFESIEPFGNDGVAWFRNMRPDRRATWRNETTFRTLDLYLEYEPGICIERIGPTPLLMITGDSDTLTPTDEALAAYQRASEPKRLLILPGGHYDLYGRCRLAGMAAARDWFAEHLA